MPKKTDKKIETNNSHEMSDFLNMLKKEVDKNTIYSKKISNDKLADIEDTRTSVITKKAARTKKMAKSKANSINCLHNNLIQKNDIISRKTEESDEFINLNKKDNNINESIASNIRPTFKNLANLKFEQDNFIKQTKFYSAKVNRIHVDFINTSNNRISLPESVLKKLFKPIDFLFSKIIMKKADDQYISYYDENNKFISTLTDDGIEDIFSEPNRPKISLFFTPKDIIIKTASFALIAAFLIMPLEALTYFQDLQSSKDKILLITNQAIENLKLAEQAAVTMDFDNANFQFIEAQDNFNLAQQEIDNLSFLTAEIIKLLPKTDSNFDAGVNLLKAGEIVAETGQILTASGNRFLKSKNIDDYYQSLVEFQSDLEIIINKFNEAESKIKNIKSSDLPQEHQKTFEKVLGYLPKISSGLTDIYTINSGFLRVLGKNQWQRYLVVFLNNNELRGGGGFMGSFAILDIDRGKIKKMDIPAGGTYDIKGQLVPKVISPDPFHLINPRWEFQDSNWWPDFPTNAKKIQWFYQNAGGPSTDGVIAITSTLMEKLLEIFGPITMTEYGREIDSENFTEETQKIVQLEYDKKENRPKQFIADLAPKLMERIFNASGEEMKKVAELLKESLNQKHLMVYFNNESTENIIRNFGWSGEIKRTDGDYLSVVHTNLAGGKTDGVIKETIEHTAEIQPDGSIINTVKLIRKHNGIAKSDIFTGVQNNSYVRFYTPMGSSLLSAEGFQKPSDDLFKKPLPEYQKDVDLISIESDKKIDDKSKTDIYNESGKTVFGNWLQLKPGETKEAVIKYRLPFKVALKGQNTFYYSFLAQKQLGSLGSDLRSNLKLNDSLKILAKFPTNLPSEEAILSFSDILATDQFYGAVLVTKNYE